jgi:hypothetical protein
VTEASVDARYRCCNIVSFVPSVLFFVLSVLHTS